MDSGLCANYLISFDTINPFYLQGDFDGDGRPDYIVSVTQRKHGWGLKTLLYCHLVVCAGFQRTLDTNILGRRGVWYSRMNRF